MRTTDLADGPASTARASVPGTTAAPASRLPLAAYAPRSPRRRIGEWEVLAVPGREPGQGHLLGPQFPSASPGDWGRARLLDAGGGWPESRWRPWAYAFVVRGHGRLVLVLEGSAVGASIRQHLADHAIAASEIDTVVLGRPGHVAEGAVLTASGRPVFRRARHLVRWSDLRDRPLIGSPSPVGRLAAFGLLDIVDGQTTVAGEEDGPAVTLLAPPDAPPGRPFLRVSAPGATLLLTRDLFAHAVQLVNPDIAFVGEGDSEVARCARWRVVHRARRERTVLAVPRLGDPFVSFVAG
ncbi:MAG: hypothetical protein ABI890_07820 [Lapillicoccus sp.]